MVPGKHKDGILPQESDGSLERSSCETWPWEPILCDVGDVVFFESHAPHRSEANKSDAARRAFYLTYNAKSDGGYFRDEYYRIKKEMFPPDADREVGRDYSEGGKIFNLATPITEKK